MGYCYCCNNKYNLKKCLSHLKARKIKYTIYEDYFISEVKLNDLHATKYYVEYIGEVQTKRYKNNEISNVVSEKKSILAYGCALKRNNKQYTLIIGDYGSFKYDRTEMIDKLMRKHYITEEDDFFERGFNQIHVNAADQLDVIAHESDILRKQEANVLTYDTQDDDNEKLDDEFVYDENCLDKDIEEDLCTLEQYEGMLEEDNFNFTQTFFYMTKNQLQILSLTLLGVSAKAIGLMLKTTSTYVLLERCRIVKKIREKLGKKTEWRFCYGFKKCLAASNRRKKHGA